MTSYHTEFGPLKWSSLFRFQSGCILVEWWRVHGSSADVTNKQRRMAATNKHDSDGFLLTFTRFEALLSSFIHWRMEWKVS